MADARLREIRLLAQGLGAAISADPKFFAAIQEYGRRLQSTDLSGVNREKLEDLVAITGRIETFFDKYRGTPDSGFYIEPSQISNSDDDLKRLETLMAELEALKDEELERLGGAATPAAPARNAPGAEAARRVFIVHGHETGPRDAVANLLRTLGLEPVVLASQPNRGRTIIEKFEDHVDVTFAIVVMTPDDVGGISSDTKSKTAEEALGRLLPRARQNVVLELGYFIGRLGRARVAALVTGDVERPSDVEGVLYIPFGRGWETDIIKELVASGIEVDTSRYLAGG